MPLAGQQKQPYSHWTREQLIAELERVSNEFGLRWDKRQADRTFEDEQHTSLVVLDHEAGLSAGAAPHQNLLIEGDNFDALRYLSVTHRGKVKCIYIDPPYNTGNSDFIYRDNFLDREAAFRHSKWLAFMSARLQLAKELLARDGVILVSIDDNEYHHLKMLMDQVFAGMYQATFVWKRRSGSNDAKGAFVSTDHEYVLCYAGKGFAFWGEKKAFENYKSADGDAEPWMRDNLTKAHTYKDRPNTFYPLHNPESDIWYPCNPKTVWRFSSKTRLKPGQKLRAEPMEDLVLKNKILFPVSERTARFSTLDALKAAIRAGDAPAALRLDLYETVAENDAYLSFFVGKALGYGSPGYKRHLSEVKRSEKPLSTWVLPSSEREKPDSEDVEFLRWGYTGEGTKLIQAMLGKKAFSYPKPLSLVKALLEQATRPGDLVLDFFGGSGTTGHAVLAINAENEGDEPRRFIVASSTEATNAEPDKNICRDVTAARLRAAVEGYQVRTKKGLEQVEGLGGGFAYLRARSLPVEKAGLELRDAQIWHALQLMHGDVMVPYDEAALMQTLEVTEGLVAFCANPETALESIERQATQHGAVLLFARKVTDATRSKLSALGNVTCQPVPQELLDMFGITQ